MEFTRLQIMNKHKKIAVLLLFFEIFFLSSLLYSQKIPVKAYNLPLNTVLINMRDKYDIQLSFNDYQLSQYRVSLDSTFTTVEDALRHLISSLPLTISRSGEVFIISYSGRQMNQIRYLISGQVRDKMSGESLPFSQLLFKNKWTETDFLGQFTFQTFDQPPYDLKVTNLGYYILDTVVSSGSDIILELEPSRIYIDEIFIYGNKIENSIQSGRNIGEIKINHQISRFLPGNGDNSVFNLLRLQTGISAAGETSNDIIIWGSYEGQSRVLFDGYTIFNLKNFNDNISAVNPFLAKDIRVLKGGYGPQYGERVGGVVIITGVEGARETPEVKISLNNLTLNGYLSVPLAKRSSFVLAFRQTYYDLYESSKLSLFSGMGRFITNTSTDGIFNVYPNYIFRDLNLKLSGETAKGDNWHVSLFAGSDRFSYLLDDTTLTNYFYNSTDEKSIQKASSAFYSKKWNRGGITRFTASYSGLDNYRKDAIYVKRLQMNSPIVDINNTQNTDIIESDLRIDHYSPFSEKHSIEMGTGLIIDQVLFREDTSEVMITNKTEKNLIFQGYITDMYHIGKKIVLKPGLRVNYLYNISKPYFQPRLSLTINPTNQLRINAAIGHYKQFMALSSVIDIRGNYNYRWTISDNKKFPVLSSNHYASGISYVKDEFEISAEVYHKTTKGLTRMVTLRNNMNISTGNSKSNGLDIFLKQSFNRNTFWISYSLSNTMEHYDYFFTKEYRRALHDQLHELKLAGIVYIKSFYFSGNWIFGSGYNLPSSFIYNLQQSKPYNRLDLSLVYHLLKNKYQLDTGISMLNVFNTENIKYSNYTRIPLIGSSPISIQSEAIPRTLTLFINFTL